MRLFGGRVITEAKPKEGALSMFLVLMKLADVHVAIGVNLTPKAIFFVIRVAALVDSAISIESDS